MDLYHSDYEDADRVSIPKPPQPPKPQSDDYRPEDDFAWLNEVVEFPKGSDSPSGSCPDDPYRDLIDAFLALFPEPDPNRLWRETVLRLAAGKALGAAKTDDAGARRKAVREALIACAVQMPTILEHHRNALQAARGVGKRKGLPRSSDGAEQVDAFRAILEGREPCDRTILALSGINELERFCCYSYYFNPDGRGMYVRIAMAGTAEEEKRMKRLLRNGQRRLHNLAKAWDLDLCALRAWAGFCPEAPLDQIAGGDFVKFVAQLDR